MINRDELIKTIHHIIGEELLEKANKVDENANGVQIHGAKEVTKIALGVTATLDFFQEAFATHAEFCMFHHGLPLAPRFIAGAKLNKSQEVLFKYIFAHDLTVAGYHYSLDAHPELGNNATIIRELGAKRLEIPYSEGWGWVAEFARPTEATKLADKLAAITSHDVFAVYGGTAKIKRMAVCSGNGKPLASDLHDIARHNIDLLVSGEIGEGDPAIAKQAGFNYFSAGHYATEVFGVQELGKKIKEKFGDKLEVEFIDIPNIL